MASFKDYLGSGFNASAVEPAKSMEVLPAGMYTVELTNVDINPLKSGNGIGMALEVTVIDPKEFSGRKIWSNLNIKHNSEKAQSMGQSQLSALCFAVGINQLETTDQLFGKVLKVKTKISPAKDNYEARADIESYAPAVAAPAPAPASTPPWARK